MRAAIIVASLAIMCSTWQQITTCTGLGGYRSTETQWQGFTTGQDSDGRRWTTSRWRDIETIGERPAR
jgi:hypothetical protein